MWRVVNFLQVLFAAGWSAGWITVGLALRLATGSPRATLKLARHTWAPGLLWAGGVRLEVHGVERLDYRRPWLFAANHQSIIDIPVLMLALPVPLRFVAKDQLRKVPFLGRYIRAMGMVFVRLDSGVRGVAAVGEVASILAGGECVATFPEGTRSSDGAVGPFKPGSLAPAIQTGVPVVPVAIAGAGRVLPRGGFRVRPGKIRLLVGEPIETAGLSLSDRADLARRVRARVVEMLG